MVGSCALYLHPPVCHPEDQEAGTDASRPVLLDGIGDGFHAPGRVIDTRHGDVWSFSVPFGIAADVVIVVPMVRFPSPLVSI